MRVFAQYNQNIYNIIVITCDSADVYVQDSDRKIIAQCYKNKILIQKKHASTHPGKEILMDTLKAPENSDLTLKFGTEFNVFETFVFELQRVE